MLHFNIFNDHTHTPNIKFEFLGYWKVLRTLPRGSADALGLSFWGKLTRFSTALSHAFGLSSAITMTMPIMIMT